LASLVLATFDFVTDGAPGNGLPPVLRWFGITIADPALSRWVGFFLLVVLGAVWGLIFGALQRDTLVTAGRALLTGLALGVLWWLIFELALTNITNHAPSPFSQLRAIPFIVSLRCAFRGLDRGDFHPMASTAGSRSIVGRQAVWRVRSCRPRHGALTGTKR